MDKSFFKFLLGEDKKFKELFEKLNYSIDERVKQLNNFSDLSQFGFKGEHSSINTENYINFIENTLPNKFQNLLLYLNEKEKHLLFKALQVQSIEHGKERYFGFVVKMFIENKLKKSVKVNVDYDIKDMYKIDKSDESHLGEKNARLGFNSGRDSFILGNNMYVKSNIAMIEIGPITFKEYEQLNGLGWGDTGRNVIIKELAKCLIPFNYKLDISFIIRKEWFKLAKSKIGIDSLRYKYV